MFDEVIEFIKSLYEGKKIIPLHEPIFRGNEKNYLKECIDSTYVSSVGKFVDQFEVEMANYTGATQAVACVNGTSALHLALRLIGAKPGQEVLTQPLTFIATANAISYCGARPVFLDVDMDTMGLSPVALKKFIETQTYFNHSTLQLFNSLTHKQISACVPMHTFGHPCRIDEIVEICNQYNITVVEDAAESLGSYFKDKHTGTFGLVGVLSFNGNKIITTGGGGMLLFQDEELAKHAKHLTKQAKIPNPWEYSHDETGYNYRMPNINAALGLAQLEQLPDFLKTKRFIAESYKNFFSTLDSTSTSTLAFFVEPPGAQSNYWLNCLLFKNKKERDAFLKFSNENGVMTRPAWKLMNELPMFSDCQTDELKNARIIAEGLVNLPSSVLPEM